MTPTTPDPAAVRGVEIKSLTRVFGEGTTAVHAVRGVSLTVAPGELVAVMGPSGSGKSSLLACVGGLDAATSGEVLIDGVSLGEQGPEAAARLRRRRIGYVFQDLNLIPALTAAENVALPLELDGVRARAARQQAITVLDEVGVGEVADRFPAELSGGQQQRVAIARAVVGERGVLLADEPTGALDSETGEAVLRVLRDRCDTQGVAGMLVTHDARHAAWADRIVFLRDGRMVDDSGRTPDVDVLLTEPGGQR